MRAGTIRTWAKRAILIGLLLFAVGFLGTILAMQEAFAVIASEDATNKASRLADAIMKAERLKSLTRFTSPLGLLMTVGGIGAVIILKVRGSPDAAQQEDDEQDDEQDDAAALAEDSPKSR